MLRFTPLGERNVVLDPLLERVLAAPEDAGLREVWADHLHEHGDPRGELIALQVAAAGGPLTAAQDRRARSILAKHATTWLGPLAGVAMHRSGLVFDRGLVKACHLQIKNLAALTGAIGHPLWGATERVWCCDRFAWDPRLVPLLAHPVMRSLREVIGIGLHNVFLPLAQGERPLPFTSIVAIDDEWRAEDPTRLRAERSDFSGTLPALRRLGLTSNHADAGWLLELPVVQRLTELSLTRPEPVDAALLERAEAIATLTALELRPQWIVQHGEARAHAVLRFTRDAAGRFSRLAVSVAGFRGGLAPRLALPVAEGRDLTSHLGPLGPHFQQLPRTALSEVTVHLLESAELRAALHRFSAASITFAPMRH